MDSPAVNRPWWKDPRPYLAPAVIFAGLAVILGYMAAVSFEHEYHLANGNGQAGGWVSSGLAVSIDGLLAVASVAVLWAAAHGIRGPRNMWRPYLALAVGIAATIAANLFAGLHFWLLQRAVSVWSGLAVALGAEVVMWFVAARRKLASGELHPVPTCSHPLTLAGLLPLAKADLIKRGELHGEEELAKFIGVGRHYIRQLQAAPVEPPAGAFAPPPKSAPAGSSLALSNGSHDGAAS